LRNVEGERTTRALFLASIKPMLVAIWGFWFDALLPRVEDPWPDSIGLSFPFVLSGAVGVFVDVFMVGAPPARRNRAISQGTRAGFVFGGALYLISLASQVASNL
jgi:hypothetical protein